MVKKPASATMSLALHLDYEARSLRNSVRPHMHELKRSAQKAFKIHKNGDADYKSLIRDKAKTADG